MLIIYWAPFFFGGPSIFDLLCTFEEFPHLLSPIFLHSFPREPSVVCSGLAFLEHILQAWLAGLPGRVYELLIIL